MKRPLVPRGTAAAMVGVLIGLGAGGGYALASNSGKTIHACVRRHAHTLYTGRCRKGDKKLSWNQVGPQGPPGVAGQAGPSNGYSVAPPGYFFLTGLNKTIASLSVPAGTYMAFARVTPTENSAEENIYCELFSPEGNQFDSGTVSVASNESAPVVLEGPATTAGGAITLQCYEVASSGVSVTGVHLMAIKLGSVTGK